MIFPEGHGLQNVSRIDSRPEEVWTSSDTSWTFTVEEDFSIFYKVNVYSEGGFFKPHADSPCGDEMIGTLVLCLPSPHKGGELCVSHDGLEHVFDFSNHSGDKSKIQWAAFYSDCIHEVKPVLEGHRVTTLLYQALCIIKNVISSIWGQKMILIL